MKLPDSITTVTPFSKALALLLFVALPFFGFKFGYLYRESTLDIAALCPVDSILEPTPTTAVVPTYDSPLLDSLTLKFDSNKFIIGKDAGVFANNKSVSLLRLSDPSQEGFLLQIYDLSSFGPQPSIREIIGSEADEVISPLRPLTVNNKKYKLMSQGFGEGFPLSEDCYYGGGFTDNYFVTDELVGVIIRTSYNSEKCGNGPEKVKHIPDPKTLEEALKIVESIKIPK